MEDGTAYLTRGYTRRALFNHHIVHALAGWAHRGRQAGPHRSASSEYRKVSTTVGSSKQPSPRVRTISAAPEERKGELFHGELSSALNNLLGRERYQLLQIFDDRPPHPVRFPKRKRRTWSTSRSNASRRARHTPGAHARLRVHFAHWKAAIQGVLGATSTGSSITCAGERPTPSASSTGHGSGR